MFCSINIFRHKTEKIKWLQAKFTTNIMAFKKRLSQK